MEKKKGLVISAIIILFASLGVLSYLLLRAQKENKEMSQLFEIEKAEMENEYSHFANQYDALQIEITRLKKELKTVRAVMRSYIAQIDSLNRINLALTTENEQVKQKYNEATRQISNLVVEKKNLNEKVTLAAQLDVTNIHVTPKNKRGKITKKTKNITKLTIDFTIVKNITADTGERTLYIRITKPDNEVLTKNTANTFPYEDQQIGYSIKKYIEYTGEEQQITVYWEVEEFLQAGTYQVYIFADGNMIGSQSFALE